MILKNSLNYLNEFFTFCLNQARQYYLSTKLYDKKISRVTSNNLEYKPSPSLLDCIIKYNKEKKILIIFYLMIFGKMKILA